MIYLYNLITFIASILLAPVFLSYKRGRYLLKNRFGLWGIKDETLTWFHAASMGEMLGMNSVIEEFKKKYPNKKILLTSFSSTGIEKNNLEVDFKRIIPFDNTIWIKNALKTLKIERFIFSETEIWPSLLKYLKENNADIFLINARITKKSYDFYNKIKIFQDAFKYINKILSQDSISNNFFKLLKKENVKILGNSKHDFNIKKLDQKKKEEIENLFSKKTVVFGSIRPKEEDFYFPVIAKLIQEGLDLNFIIAPRHAEKFNYFADKLKSYNINFNRWSDNSTQESTLLLDTIGELIYFQSIADLSFIGGTLVDGYGGHNPMEPTIFSVPPVIGPYYENQVEIVEKLNNDNACINIKDTNDIYNTIKLLFINPESIKEISNSAYKVYKENSNISEKIIHEISN